MTLKLADGIRLEGDWYAVQRLDAWTFAIGEPLYHQQNWSYLLLGTERALLFDTGSFCRDISPVIARLAPDALTILPSHMHYDHLGNITRFGRIAVADLPLLRQCVSDGILTPTEDLFLGNSENNIAPGFRVDQWLPIGCEIDLGGRILSVLHTPGHSADSISLWCEQENRLFAADFIYPGDLYAQVPGASLADYLRTSESLVEIVHQGVEIYCAHGDVAADQAHSAPRLGLEDLADLDTGLRRIERAARAGQWADAEETRFCLSKRLAIRVGRRAIADWVPAQ